MGCLGNLFSHPQSVFAHDVHTPRLASYMALTCYTLDIDEQNAAGYGQQNQPPGTMVGTLSHTLDTS